VWSGQCAGVSEACFSMLGSLACDDQSGCFYDFTTSTCTGISDSCDFMTDDFDCASQQGCSWTGTCSGAPTMSCSLYFDEVSCTSAGCLWL
jgi:hypothetical protein